MEENEKLLGIKDENEEKKGTGIIGENRIKIKQKRKVDRTGGWRITKIEKENKEEQLKEMKKVVRGSRR